MVRSAATAITDPRVTAPTHIRASITRSFGRRGGRAITSSVSGSTPMARAGAVSVIRLIHRIWVASRGSTTASPFPLSPRAPARTTPKKMVRTSPMLDDSRSRRNFGCCRECLVLRVRPRRSSRSCRRPGSSSRPLWSPPCRSGPWRCRCRPTSGRGLVDRVSGIEKMLPSASARRRSAASTSGRPGHTPMCAYRLGEPLRSSWSSSMPVSAFGVRSTMPSRSRS